MILRCPHCKHPIRIYPNAEELSDDVLRQEARRRKKGFYEVLE